MKWRCKMTAMNSTFTLLFWAYCFFFGWQSTYFLLLPPSYCFILRFTHLSPTMNTLGQLKWFAGLCDATICCGLGVQLHTVLANDIYGLKRSFTYLKLDKEAWCLLCQPSFFFFILYVPCLRRGMLIIKVDKKQLLIFAHLKLLFTQFCNNAETWP